MTDPTPTGRGRKREIVFRPRRVRYSGNGLRSVPLAKTLAGIESYFLTSEVEAQFEMVRRTADDTIRAVLEYLPPPGEPEALRYFGKGATAGQALVSACMEFVERLAARMRPGDALREASLAEVAPDALDPRLFGLSSEAAFDVGQRIDWIWGYSLTLPRPVLVPANLVFFPYTAERDEKYIAWTDSNGLASGNNLEEAVLHGLLEVVERDAVVIGEFNRLPVTRILPDGLPAETVRVIRALEAKDFSCSFAAVPSDLPIPVVSAFLRRKDDPADCCVAYGCHLDPALAVSRALTEAVQLLPPAVNQKEWLRSGSPERHAARPEREVRFEGLGNLASADLKGNIDRCVAILSEAGVEVIVVDLSVSDIPFPAVRVLAAGLQPLLHEGDMRLSQRFFDVPVRLGVRAEPLDRADIKIWPLCGYR